MGGLARMAVALGVAPHEATATMSSAETWHTVFVPKQVLQQDLYRIGQALDVVLLGSGRTP